LPNGEIDNDESTKIIAISLNYSKTLCYTLGVKIKWESEALDPSDLPTDRTRQFFFMIRHHFLLLFDYSLTFFLFQIPFYLVLIGFYIPYVNLLNAETHTASALFSLLFEAGLTAIPALGVFGIGGAGIYGAIGKLLCENDASYKDFFLSIKKNWRGFLLAFLLNALLFFLALLNYAAFLYVDANVNLKLIGLCASLLLLGLFLLARPYLLFQIVFFENGFGQRLKNSLILSLGKLFSSLSLFFASYGLFIAMMFSPMTAISIELVFQIIIGSSLSVLLNLEMVFANFETRLGREQMANLYRKGLGAIKKKTEK